MSRAPLTAQLLGVALLASAAGLFAAVDPHIDPVVVPGSCPACHQGHGLSGSPMLPSPQSELCLACHGSQADQDRVVAEEKLGSGASPPLLSAVLSQPFTHPIDSRAYSRFDSGVVVCTSCHSPHRGSVPIASERGEGERRKLSTRDPDRFEFELCQSCHGSQGVAAEGLLDLSLLTNPDSGSFHPIEAPTRDRSPSVDPDLSGREVNCTDCHGNSDTLAPEGPHGSDVRYLLVREYVTIDGDEESEEVYLLCYSCHDRDAVLDSPLFPLHRLHVVEERASCATCHNPHGSQGNRALIRFGEETLLAAVETSLKAGILAYESRLPGSGACYLTCHGVDHGPEGYGVDGLALEAREALPGDGLLLPPTGPVGTELPVGGVPRPGVEKPRKKR